MDIPRWHTLRRRRRSVVVSRFDAAAGRWVGASPAGDAARGALTLTTFNVWNKPLHAEQRYQAIADLLARDMPDVAVFQEVTPTAQAVLLDQPWVRERCLHVGVTGARVGGYGILMLSRLPIAAATFTRLPSRRARGFLQADVAVNGATLRICSVHLESGKDGAWLRAWQLRRVFRAVTAQDAVILGDFNMRDGEDRWLPAHYRDLWPALRPHEPGFTEDTSTNPMLRDNKKKPRQQRFDRVLLTGRRWTPEGIEVIGTEPVSPALPRVLPSDHFGLRCRLGAQRQQ
ncbi:MAG: endonuclease/exonuclease/phosphatase family protein [Actinomycetota bacterium]|nr:endonuclease/exonuclease/phosphatase family protein [Actinomycetota bacterium]